jgi:hypothetical protein
MTPKRLKQLAANPEHIPGVYNYCDRWCERCPLTARCLNYAMEREQLDTEFDGDEASRDMDNQKFWKVMHDNFKLVFDMIAEDCAARGIDFEQIRREARELKPSPDRHQRRREHPLVAEATAYTMRVHEWFKAHRDTFEAKAGELVSTATMGLPGADPEADAEDLADAADVVQWYHMFIGVKLARAVGQDDDEFGDLLSDDGDDDPEIRQAHEESMRSDALGSAKVALIGIDRSLVAWTRLREHFPDEADVMLDFLLQLDRLRREAERTFPDARAFARPGFDDGTLE